MEDLKIISKYISTVEEIKDLEMTISINEYAIVLTIPSLDRNIEFLSMDDLEYFILGYRMGQKPQI